MHITNPKDYPERAVLVGKISSDILTSEVENQLKELAFLAETAGAISIQSFYQVKENIDPATFIGKGKLNTIINYSKSSSIKIIVFNDELSPTQLKNIQKIAGNKIKVIDRTGLILDIFDKHAKTKESKTQVQLARLEYLLPRLTKQWTHLERQMGGVGTRGGPGETQIEIDRRLVRNQITKLKKDLKKIELQRLTQRSSRTNVYKVALVGYTNAGKSTLMKALTSEDVYIKNQLFATLDTKTKLVDLSDGVKFLLSDTVGFIRRLPHDLVASFRSTLSEVKEANLIIKVLDLSSLQFKQEMNTIDEVLNRLNINVKDSIIVLNKIDLVDDMNLIKPILDTYPNSIIVSAHRQLNLSTLLKTIEDKLKRNFIKDKIFIPFKKSKYINKIYSEMIVRKRVDNYKGTYIYVEGDSGYIENVKKRIERKS